MIIFLHLEFGASPEKFGNHIGGDCEYSYHPCACWPCSVNWSSHIVGLCLWSCSDFTVQVELILPMLYNYTSINGPLVLVIFLLRFRRSGGCGVHTSSDGVTLDVEEVGVLQGTVCD